MPSLIHDLLAKWPSAIVARTEVKAFSGGLLNPRTLANLDSLGQGPVRLRVGRKICYRAADLAAWIEQRTKPDSVA